MYKKFVQYIVFCLILIFPLAGLANDSDFLYARYQDYDAALDYQTYPASLKFMKPGDQTSLTVKFRNTGQAIWRRQFINLGTWQKQDNSDPFWDPQTWRNSARPAALLEEEVKPGEVGTFIFTVRAPLLGGYYRQYFRPVAELVGWFGPTDIYWEFFVESPVPKSLVSWRLPTDRTLSMRPVSFPNAPRPYRIDCTRGVHEGFDFYAPYGANVYAPAGGKIVRADHQYDNRQTMDSIQYKNLTDDIMWRNLDLLRGRQVWVDHGGGWVTHYAHLSAVNEDIHVGDLVDRGQILGQVGKTGIPGDYYVNYHLHWELWANDKYFGQGMDYASIKKEVTKMFGMK